MKAHLTWHCEPNVFVGIISIFFCYNRLESESFSSNRKMQGLMILDGCYRYSYLQESLINIFLIQLKYQPKLLASAEDGAGIKVIFNRKIMVIDRQDLKQHS